MLSYVIRRLIALVPVLVGISLVVFFLIRLIPGDIVDVLLGTQVQASSHKTAELRRLFGLDQPIYLQYLHWMGDTLRGDLGHSLRTGKPVLAEIVSRLPVTIELTVMSVLFGLLLAIPTGIVAAVKAGTKTEAGMQSFGLLGLSIPNFWLGTLLILVTSRYFGWFPAARYVAFTVDPWRNLQVFILPGIALGTALAAITMRMVRSALLETLNREYLMAARARGLNERSLIVRHALKNALIPVVTVVGIQIGRLLGGAIIIEQLFNLPGIGRLTIDAIQQRDYAMIQGVVLFTALAFVLVNLVVDLLYAYVDPRIRYG